VASASLATDCIYLVAGTALGVWISRWVSAETARSLNSWILLFRFLIVGPAAIRWAMHANYRGFRLQAIAPNDLLDGVVEQSNHSQRVPVVAESVKPAEGARARLSI
jgi:hypothetical protein